jgi:hypothetical protein
VAIGIHLNIVLHDGHVLEAKRYIHTVKEHTCSIYNTLPFTKMHSRMIIEMVYLSVFWLNMFLATDGVSTTMSPRTIIAGLQLDYIKHCKLEFGAYTQVHEEHNNSMNTRTTGAIALRPTGNTQGGYYFYSLTTARKINQNCWTSLPMPADVISRVHTMARQNNIPPRLTFTDQASHVVPDADNNSNDDPSDNNSDVDTVDDGHIAGVYDDNEQEEENEI